MTQFDCVCIGRACVDFLNLVKGYPPEDSKVPSSKFLLEGGGQASTAACFLSNLGINTLFLGQIGNDQLGDILINKIEEYGVCSDFVNIEEDGDTPSANIIVAPQKETRTIIYQESNLPEWTLSSRQREMIKNSKVVLLDPQEMNKGERISTLGGEETPTVVCDIERTAPEQIKMARFADFYVTSSHFLEELLENRELKRRVSINLQKNGPALITTFGKRGSIGIRDGEIFRVSALDVDVKDTTGAGDIYHGGICYGVIQGWSLEKTMQFASIAASLSCQALGSRAGMPSKEDIFAHLDWKTPHV